jgi:putative membrane protein
MKRVAVLLGCLAFATPVLAQTAVDRAQSAGEKSGVNSVLGITPATDDFVKAVAMSDMFEIQASKIAEDKGNAGEKSFAVQMVTDHTKTSDQLKALVKSKELNVTLPTALDSSHQSKLDKLQKESGKDFNSDFDAIQVSAHKDAVSLFERYAKGGDNADLKAWAAQTLPALQHHLDMAQKLGKS